MTVGLWDSVTGFFEDLGDFFKEIFEKNQGYQSNVLDIEGSCKISKEEAK